MGDLKSVFDNPVMADHGLAGDSVTSSGSDPHIVDALDAGPAGLQPVWPDAKRITTAAGTEETANSSGLPPLPNRFEPSPATPPPPPSLQDRAPGTIDQK